MSVELKDVPAFDVPFEVGVVDGEVVIMGPDGFCGSFTKEAARESSRRLAAAAGGDDNPTYQKPLG
jgi:hypothetical protein